MSTKDSKKTESAPVDKPKKAISKPKTVKPKASVISKPKEKTVVEKPKKVTKPKAATKPKADPVIPKYSVKHFNEILERVMCGEAIAEICRSKGMPSRVTFYRWLNADEKGDLRGRYDDACAIRADYLADEIVRIADDSTLDVEFKANGDINYSKKSVERSKLMIDARKWTASKLRPKLWGNQVAVDLNVDASEESIQALQAIGEKNMALAMAKAEEIRRRLANQNLDDEE